MRLLAEYLNALCWLADCCPNGYCYLEARCKYILIQVSLDLKNKRVRVVRMLIKDERKRNRI